jgi:hypothetical protein
MAAAAAVKVKTTTARTMMSRTARARAMPGAATLRALQAGQAWRLKR